MHPHVAPMVKVELEKLLKANFIRAIDYAEWISNIVPIFKHNKSIHVCTDFRDLNKAFAKDDFWQGRRDSNSQHPVLETGALPIELRP